MRRRPHEVGKPIGAASAEPLPSAAGLCTDRLVDNVASLPLIAGSACTCSLTLLGQGRRLAQAARTFLFRVGLSPSPATAPSGMAPLRASRCPLLRSLSHLLDKAERPSRRLGFLLALSSSLLARFPLAPPELVNEVSARRYIYRPL